MVHINVTHSLCGLFPGLIAGDSISFDKQKVSGKEGASVTLKCTYDTGSDNVHLHWYRLQPIARILSLYSLKEQGQRVPNYFWFHVLRVNDTL